MPNHDEAHAAGHFGEGQQRGLDSDVMSVGVCHHHTSRREAQIQRARHLAADGERWCREEVDAYDFLKTYALARAAEERRFSGQELAELVRNHDFTNHRTGEPTTINNDLVAWLVRELVKRYPQLRPFVTTRQSIFDLLEDSGEVQGDEVQWSGDDQKTDPWKILDDLLDLMHRFPRVAAAEVADYAQDVWGL